MIRFGTPLVRSRNGIAGNQRPLVRVRVVEVLVFLLIGPRLVRVLAPGGAIALASVAGIIRWTVPAFTTSPLLLAFVQPLHGFTEIRWYHSLGFLRLCVLRAARTAIRVTVLSRYEVEVSRIRDPML
jgi:hypothetical protein